MKTIFTLQETAQLIKQNKALMIAGEEALLKQLPKGDWIGGTTGYFIGDDGKINTNDQLFVITKSDYVESVKIKDFTKGTIKKFPSYGYKNGMSLIIIPAFSDIHQNYAETVMEFEGIFDRPVAGWVSGVHLDDLATKTPMVINGKTGKLLDSNAVVAQLKLKKGICPQLDIVNPFKQNEGDIITFDKTGFNGDIAFINGKRTIFSEYLTEQNVDPNFPLVADFNGSAVNVSFKEINKENSSVSFYAPVFEDVEYRLGTQVENLDNLNPNEDPLLSVNCILNYIHPDLKKEQISKVKGPITFGEIAYQLLNQTMVNISTK